MTIRDVIRIARDLSDGEILIPRRRVIEDGVRSEDELLDEMYWATEEHKENLKVVSIVNALWLPLRVQRSDLFDIQGNSYVTSSVINVPMNCRMMSYCCEYLNTQQHKAEIKIHNDGNRLCVKRFLWTKELAHLYTRTVTGDLNRNHRFLAPLLQEDALNGTLFVDNADAELAPESVGFYLAIELLIPWCLREQFERVRELYDSNWALARAFLVPQFVIRHIREDHFRMIQGGPKRLNYLALSREINSQF